MTRENWLKVVELRGCGEVPCHVVFAGAVWNEYRDRLQDVVLRYPGVFGEYRRREGSWDDFGPRERRGQRWTDRWGCVWDYAYDGIEGQVVGHPLTDWRALNDLKAPDPARENDLDTVDWDSVRRQMEEAHQKDLPATGWIPHGFLFQRLYYLRGFENLMLDFASGDGRLGELIQIIVHYNLDLVRRWLAIGPDVIYFGDDLGMQDRLTVSPDMWRRHIKPAYARLFQECRQSGVHVYLHSDGYIADIFPDLIEIGVSIVNPQDLCNGLQRIRRELKGKVCIELDIDRQRIVPWGTPQEIECHIRRCVEMLGSPQGGLSLVCGIYPGTPLANIEAVARAMDRYRTVFCRS